MYICLECGHHFEDGEEAIWEEQHGLEDGPYEKMSGCPICESAYAVAGRCKKCGHDFLEDNLYSGLCKKCLIESALPETTADYVHDRHLACSFYGEFYDGKIERMSNNLEEVLRGGMLQQAALDKLKRASWTRKKCAGYIMSDEAATYDFSIWLQKRGGTNATT